MGILDSLRKARDAVIGTSSLATQAKLSTSQQNNQAVVIPDDVQQAMDDAGMTRGGAFSPGEPIAPYQAVGTDPIVTPYMVGENIYMVPRGTTGVGFDALKNITTKWDVARLCMEVRLDELRGLDWEIVAAEGEDGDKYADELKKARQFFEHPSPGQDFDDLQTKAGEDWQRYDSLTIARRRTRNGKLGALEAIDGTTIAPLIDARGAMPQGNAPAYVQWAWGLPWVWLTDKDIIYKPHHPRPETRYGLPPAEWVMLNANTDLRLQWYFLSYFTQGEVPEVFINAPPDVQDPKQVKALQDAYSAVMSGAQAVHHKVKWIPPGSQVHPINKGNFDVDFAGWLLAKACAAFKVQPAEIGFTEKVNKSSSDGQTDIAYRRTIKPTVKYFEAIWNRILREDFNMPYARFKYLNVEEEEDQLQLANTRAVYIQNAVLSPDEVRAELGYDIDPDAPVGRSFATRTGIIFVDPASQERARASGSLATQAGLNDETTTNSNDGVQDTNDDANEETSNFLTPDQTIVDPALKPQPPQPNAPTKTVESELRKWRQVAVKRAKDGRPQKDFQTDIIPPMVRKLVNAQLTKAKSADEVRDIFALALGGDAPLAKRTIPQRGRVVVRDNKKLDAATKKLQIEIGVTLNKESGKVAKYVRSQIGSAQDEVTATDEKVLRNIVGSYAWDRLDQPIIDAANDPLLKIFTQGADEGAKSVGTSLSFDQVNPLAVAYAQNRGAELVGKIRTADGTLIDNPNAEWSIPDATRNMIQDYVVSAVKNGGSPADIEQGILAHYAFSDARAETIARSETGIAYNNGAIGGYREVGVTEVEVMDGDDDAECSAANGETWSLDEAEAEPLAHPNCTRAFLPIVPDDMNTDDDESPN